MTTSKDLCQLNFLTFKNRGHTYVRAYRNVWIPKKVDDKGNVLKKAGSAPAEQHQVGALLPSGRVKISKNFLKKFPVFEGVDWYFLDRQLVDEETYYSKTPDPVEQAAQQTAEPETDHVQTQQQKSVDAINEAASFSGPEVKNFLPYFALASLAQANGLFDALKEVFGKQDAICWRDYAIYQILNGGSADCFQYWAMDQHLPNISAKMDGRKISKLLQGCSQEAWDRFWKARFDQAKKIDNANGDERLVRFCAFDSTSISTYADWTPAAYGHAKQDSDLKQINLATVMDQLTGIIVYAFVYEGSINDKATYSYVYSRMQQAGFPMNEIMLVTDRGYYSSGNAYEMLKNNAHYLSAVPIAKDSVEEKWIIEQGDSIKDMPHFWDNVNQVAHFRRQEKWKLPDGSFKETYTHILFDPDTAQEAKSSLNNLLTRTVDSLNKGLSVDQQAFNSARPYLKQIPNPDGKQHMQVEKIWVFNQPAIERHHKRAGFWVLKTDVVDDPVVAVTLYRMREYIEQGFDQLKNEVNGRRLRVQERSHLGKVLHFLLAVSLRVNARFRFDHHKQLVPCSKLEIPSNSLDTFLARINRYKIRRMNPSQQWLLDLVPKSVQSMLNVMFGIGRLPKRMVIR